MSAERDDAPPTAPTFSRWAKIRAGLVLGHVVAVVVLTTPGRGALLNKNRWKTANAQDDLRRWADRLRGWGIDTDKQRLQRSLWETASSYANVRDTIAEPFEVYRDAVRMKQGWAMFASPQRHPGEVHVEIMVDGQWQLIFRPHDPVHAWNQGQFEHNRFRKFMGRFARDFRRKHWDETCSWIATKAAREHPDATAVRVRLYRYASLPPQAVQAGEVPQGRYEHPRQFDAQVLR